MKAAHWFVIIAAVFVAVACGQAPTEQASAPAAEPMAEHANHDHGDQAVEARHDILYVCNCGPDCDCGSVSLEPGTCSCGSELAKAHMLRIDGNIATVCMCSGDCRCKLDPADPSKCTCGESVKQVSFEGKGLYYCNCGGSCTCNHVAGAPGECHCGMALVTS